jgi:putative transposase
MSGKQISAGTIDVKALLERDEDYLRAMVAAIVEATLEAEMTAALGAEEGRAQCRACGLSGRLLYDYTRSLVTRVGTLELRVPQDRDGRFSTRLFER